MLVRREAEHDHGAVRAVHEAAFPADDNGRVVEPHLVDELRASGAWLPALSWVAEIEGRVVGHVVCTRAHVGNLACVGLAPVGVLPEHQRQGVGSALMHAVIGAADACGEPLIGLLGDPGYYARFGFRPSADLGVAPPVDAWGSAFQVRLLSTAVPDLRGTFAYSEPFNRLG